MLDDNRVNEAIMRGMKTITNTMINGCALVFILMVFSLLAVLGYLIYVLCTT